jgi:ERCC4-related helicase
MIESLFTEMQAITPEHDAKLQHLQAHIADKQAKPINTGNKKVIIFTAFADTAQYLYEQSIMVRSTRKSCSHERRSMSWSWIFTLPPTSIS